MENSKKFVLHEQFKSLNFGSKPSTFSLQEIRVNINPELMLNDFAVAYAKELKRRNPVKADEVNLTSDELQSYFKGLIAIRVESIDGDCQNWRKAKALYIPTWIQFTLSQIGEVLDRVRGFKLIPSFTHQYNMDDMLSISERLASFIPDGLTMHKDAFPRSQSGDVDTMSMAVIDDYICSMDEKAHPLCSYVSAFLGMKLDEEATFKLLYRIRYDDVAFIKSMLMVEESIR